MRPGSLQVHVLRESRECELGYAPMVYLLFERQESEPAVRSASAEAWHLDRAREEQRDGLQVVRWADRRRLWLEALWRDPLGTLSSTTRWLVAVAWESSVNRALLLFFVAMVVFDVIVCACWLSHKVDERLRARRARPRGYVPPT